MKTNLIKLFVFLFIVSILAISCSQTEEVNPDQGFSKQIENFVPDSTIQTLRDMGLTIHEGTQPPNIEGIYQASPYVMLESNVPMESYEEGARFIDYRYQFRDQNMKDLSISLDTKGINYNSGKVISESTGKGAFLAGYGQEFTAFIMLEGYSTYGRDTSYSQSLEVISGEMTADGIKNFQMALVLLDDYGDPHERLIPVNTGRVFYDEDSLAVSSNSFRMLPKEQLSEEFSGLDLLLE